MRVGSTLAIGYSGMMTYGNAASVTANNVANTNTASYKAGKANIEEAAGGGNGSVVSGVSKDESQGPQVPGVTQDGTYGYVEGSNVDLSNEMVNSSIYRSAYEVNAKTIKTGAEMIRTAIDMVV